MEQKKVATKKQRPPDLAAALQNLNQSVSDDLFLTSLRERPARLSGHAFRFFLVLPLYTSQGSKVFTREHFSDLHLLFNTRFGGCLVSSSRSGAPFFGEYLPEGTKPVRDYHTVIIVYANPIEPSDRFFQELKAILKKAPLVEQDEILIERSEVYLV
jgi:hypothetical protein